MGSGEGEVTLADAMSLLDALAGARALSYRKLFDGRAVRSSMTGDDLLAVCAKIRAYHEQGPVGALAIVGTDEQSVQFARLLGALAAADRPIKLFPVCDRRALGWANREAETSGDAWRLGLRSRVPLPARIHRNGPAPGIRKPACRRCQAGLKCGL